MTRGARLAARDGARFVTRVRRALRLEAALFEEVEHDHRAGAQALIVVLLASACGGAGNMAAAALLGHDVLGAASLVVLSAAFLVAWLAWSFVTMAVGLLFGGSADMGEMQRALGFAAAPGLLMLVPGFGALVGIPWSLVAMVIAVRQALDFTTRKALLTVGVGALVTLVLLLPLLALA